MTPEDQNSARTALLRDRYDFDGRERSRVAGCPRGDGFVLALYGAQEALEVGDVRHACAILLGAIEGDGPSKRPYPCRNGCGSSYLWPGLRDGHEARCFPVKVAA